MTTTTLPVPALQLPVGTVAVFATLNGAVVALTKDAELFRTTTAAFAWQCLGCGDRIYSKRTEDYARNGANDHASKCRSLPMPEAEPKAAALAQVEVTSFGYLHGEPPTAHLTVDLRHHFRDPHVAPELRYLTAHDREVREAVLGTPGISALIDSLDAAVRAFASGPSTGPITVAVGCAGGRHRAATVAAALADRLGAVLVHRDLDKPVVNR